MQILEAFRALNALNEDTFSLDADGIKGLSDFKNNDDFEDDISIIDPEAETTEDLQDNYIGKVILDCCVCHSKLYKAKEEVTIDETGELANVGEECPYCFTPDGFKVIGEVAAFEGAEDKEADGEEEEPIEELFDVSVPTTTSVTANVNADLGDITGGLLGENLNEGIFGFKTKKEKEFEAEKARKQAEYKAKCAEINARNEAERAAFNKERAEREQRYREQDKKDAMRKRYGSSSTGSSKPSNTGKAGIHYSGGDYYSENLDEGLFDKFKKNKPAANSNSNSDSKKDSYYVMVEVDNNGGCKLVGTSKTKADRNWNHLDTMRATDNEKRAGRLKVMSVAEAEKAMRTDLSRLIKESAEMNESDDDYIYVQGNGYGTYKPRTRESLEDELTESIDDLSMTANDTHVEIGEDENGKVTVTMEPATADGGEMIAPVSDETETELLGNEEEATEESEEAPVEEVDVDVDEVDEESMNELGESYFKRVYENVNGFKTTAVKQQGNALIVEGKIKFTNSRVRKTSFMFEALDATKAGKVRFVGDNKNLTEGKKAFMLTGKMKGNKLIAESLNYNYKHKDVNGEVSRVYGTERTSRR